MTCAIEPTRCIRCAACATVAPAHFTVGAGKARVTRQPSTDAEQVAAAAAAALCPTQAIAIETTARTIEPWPPHEVFRPISEVAEGVRWKSSELPWSSFDPSKLHPVLVQVAREMAFSEQTTFSATQRFMQAFGDDPDFSQWISVWFYEETRHPTILLRWLELAGEKLDADFVSKGRVSAPFMKSRLGTLVTNVISEMFAAEAYLGMANASPEPLLAALTLRIAADEARHGASFFTYARRLLKNDRDRLDALKVLHFWLNENASVSHPVNATMEKLTPVRSEGGLLPPFDPPLRRITRIVGLLTGLPLAAPADLPGLLHAHTARVHAEAPT